MLNFDHNLLFFIAGVLQDEMYHQNDFLGSLTLRHVQRGGRRVLEHLPLCSMMPKVPFCQGNFFFFFFFFTPFCEGLPNLTISKINDE